MPNYQVPGNSEDHSRKEINDTYADFKKASNGAYAKRPSAATALLDNTTYGAKNIENSNP